MWRSALVITALLASTPVHWHRMSAAEPIRGGEEKSVDTLDAQIREALRHGDFGPAIAAWNDLLGLLRKASDTKREIDALIGRGETYLVLGHYGKAGEDLSLAVSMAEAAGDSRRAAAASGSLGNVYYMAGDLVRSRSALESALKAARTGGFVDIAALTLNNLGNLFAAIGQGPAAEAAFRESERLARDIGNTLLVARVKVNLARSEVRIGRYAVAETSLQAAVRDLSGQSPNRMFATTLMAIGQVFADLDRLRGDDVGSNGLHAYTLFNQATGVAAAVGDSRTESYGLGNLALLYERQGRGEEALDLARRALFLAQSVDAKESLYQWQWLVGRLLAREGESKAAISAYQGAVKTLQTLRVDLPDVDPTTGQPVFRDTVGAVYLQLTDLLLKEAEHERGATEQAYLTEARATVELLRSAELKDYFQDQCVDELQARTRPVDRLAAHTAALYPLILPERLALLVTLPDGLVQASLPISREELAEHVHAFRLLLEKRTTRQFLPYAKRLYDWLVRPIERHLVSHDVDTLVFIPDGALRTVPLAALHDGDAFLIENYAVATVPGLTLFDPRPLTDTSVEILINGLTEAVQGFSSLPFVSSELQAISDIYGGTVLKDQEFVIPRLRRSLATTRYTVVHIASHGVLAKNPKESFLLTFDGRLDMDGLERFVKLGRFRESPVELLTLSACRTAAGDDRAALGLAGMAVKAGARSAVATLWFINDQASSLLVADFYRRLRQRELSKAKALQQAQLRMMRDRRYRHPGYWSPFLIIGNWL